MHDEDTGGAIRCPHCGTTDSCAHELALMDLSNGSCESGYAFGKLAMFDTLVGTLFRPLLTVDRKLAVVWADPEVEELWRFAVENDEGPEEDVALDGGLMMRLICDAFEAAGAEEPDGRATDQGQGPGHSSSLRLFYAAKPPVTFARSLRMFNKRLRPAVKAARAAKPPRLKKTARRQG